MGHDLGHEVAHSSVDDVGDEDHHVWACQLFTEHADPSVLVERFEDPRVSRGVLPLKDATEFSQPFSVAYLSGSAPDLRFWAVGHLIHLARMPPNLARCQARMHVPATASPRRGMLWA